MRGAQVSDARMKTFYWQDRDNPNFDITMAIIEKGLAIDVQEVSGEGLIVSSTIMLPLKEALRLRSWLVSAFDGE